MLYPVILAPDENGTVIAEVPDVPGVMTVGSDEREALVMARDALLTMIACLMAEKKPVPNPSKTSGRDPYVELPPLAVAKVAIHNAMVEQGVSQVALAARLHSDPKSIRRLLNLDHVSRWDHLEMALEALGYAIHAKVDRRPAQSAF